MASFNKVILIGNLVADPELKQTQSGIAVTSFSIAVSRKFNRDSSQQQTDFINIVCWRSTAEFVTKYFSKGKSILICGSLQTRTWTDQQGQKRYATEVVADEAFFVDAKGENPGGFQPAGGTAYMPENYGTPAYSTPAQSGPAKFEEVQSDEELPF